MKEHNLTSNMDKYVVENYIRNDFEGFNRYYFKSLREAKTEARRLLKEALRIDNPQASLTSIDWTVKRLVCEIDDELQLEWRKGDESIIQNNLGGREYKKALKYLTDYLFDWVRDEELNSKSLYHFLENGIKNGAISTFDYDSEWNREKLRNAFLNSIKN